MTTLEERPTGSRQSSSSAIRRNPILTAADWPYRVNAVFNPAAALVDGETVLLARVEDRTGISHLTVARSSNGVDGWTIDSEPLLAPEPGDETEVWGFEDARAVWVEELDRFAITCTAYGPAGPAVFLATTTDFFVRRTARHHQARRGQERCPPARARRRQVDPLPPSHERLRRLPRSDLPLPLRRSRFLEPAGARASATTRRLVGLAPDRNRPAARSRPITAGSSSTTASRRRSPAASTESGSPCST